MDSVQIYCAVLFSIQLLAYMLIDGQPREGVYKMNHFIIGAIISAPIYGRVFGWW